MQKDRGKRPKRELMGDVPPEVLRYREVAKKIPDKIITFCWGVTAVVLVMRLFGSSVDNGQIMTSMKVYWGLAVVVGLLLALAFGIRFLIQRNERIEKELRDRRPY